MISRRQLALACVAATVACGDAPAPMLAMDLAVDAGLAARLPPFEPMGSGMAPPVTGDPGREAQCGFSVIPEPEPAGAPYCTAETRACVDACGTLEPGNIPCVFGCLSADMTPPAQFVGNCFQCALQLLVGCAQTSGCEDEYVAQRCCQVACASGDCADPTCTAEEDAVNVCIFTRAQVCLDLTSDTYALCFGEAEDTPEGDAR